MDSCVGHASFRLKQDGARLPALKSTTHGQLQATIGQTVSCTMVLCARLGHSPSSGAANMMLPLLREGVTLDDQSMDSRLRSAASVIDAMR